MISTLELPPAAPATPPALPAQVDLLFALQLRVARRADELSRGFGVHRDSARSTWLRAEQEVFERVEQARPHALR